MEIVLESISKHFNKQWIFRNVNLRLSKGEVYAITGPNGSGKSTFIQIVSGFALASEGKLSFYDQGKLVPEEKNYEKVSIASPNLELIEEFTLIELLDFHFKFVPMIQNETKSSLINYIWQEKLIDKQIKFFSSGMKQRLKLGLALFTDKPILIFDEPTVNLDADGCKWYHKAVEEKRNGRLLIISSNIADEYSFTKNVIKISEYNG